MGILVTGVTFSDGNYSAALQLRPFWPSRIAQVCFKAQNEKIWSTAKQLHVLHVRV